MRSTVGIPVFHGGEDVKVFSGLKRETSQLIDMDVRHVCLGWRCARSVFTF